MCREMVLTDGSWHRWRQAPETTSSRLIRRRHVQRWSIEDRIALLAELVVVAPLFFTCPFLNEGMVSKVIVSERDQPMEKHATIEKVTLTKHGG